MENARTDLSPVPLVPVLIYPDSNYSFSSNSAMTATPDVPPSSSATSNMASSRDVEKAPASPDETLFQQMEVAKTILNQAVDLLDNHLTSDDQLTVHSKYLPGSTIGM